MVNIKETTSPWETEETVKYRGLHKAFNMDGIPVVGKCSWSLQTIKTLMLSQFMKTKKNNMKEKEQPMALTANLGQAHCTCGGVT